MERRDSEAASRCPDFTGLADTWTHCGPLLSHNPSSPHGPTRGNLQTSRDLAWGVDLTITYVITHNSLQYGRDVVNLFMKG